MPSGTYALEAPDGHTDALEEFRTAPGIAGSRYFATIRFPDSDDEEIVDISVDAAWQPRRLRIQSPQHHLLLQHTGDGFIGARDDEQLTIPAVTDFGYRSAGFIVTTANRLLQEGLESADVDIVRVAASTLELEPSQQRFEYLGEEEIDTAVGRFAAHAWRHTDLDTDSAGSFWIGGSIVLSYPGWLELRHYDPVGAGPFPH